MTPKAEEPHSSRAPEPEEMELDALQYFLAL